MADLQQIYVAVSGGAIALVGKYVFDRLIESHKARVGLEMKRRERYYEKQALAFSGAYEKLAQYASNSLGISIFDDELEEWHLPLLDKSTAKARKSGEEFDDFLRSNIIYFPQEFADKLDEFYRTLFTIIASIQMKSYDEPGTDVTEFKAQTKVRQAKAREILKEVQNEFRRLMLGKGL
jgi:hypothetical protein